MGLTDPLLEYAGRNWLLNCLFETPPEDLQRSCNIQLLNLLCADHLPGNENLDVRGCLARLDRLTEYIKGSIERTFAKYGPDPGYSNCKYQTWMACLVTRMKLEYGAAYSPQAKADLDAGINAPFSDASEVFINGLLREDRNRRWGTCSSIPVLVTAIARKLGYPVRLACAREHLYCRWEGEGTKFNIEASNPAGMAVESDAHYRQMRGGFPAEHQVTDYFFRSLTPAEEFACFMKDRVAVLKDAKRFDETWLWSARALQFAPDDWVYPRHAYHLSHLGLQQRYRLRYPGKDVALMAGGIPDYGEFEALMGPREHSLVLTIWGHYREAKGEIDAARAVLENACRMNFDGNNEQRDLQRFLRKHHLSSRAKWRTFRPENAQFRRFKLSCRPESEVDELHGLAGQFERNGELVKARDALHDLYLFNPCRAEVFQRARAVEKQPLFQTQLKALVEQQRRRLEQEGRLPKPPSKAPATGSKSGGVAANLKGPLNILNRPHGRSAWN